MLNRNFQKVFKIYDNHQSFKLVQKYLAKWIFITTYKDIEISVNNLKDKIIRTPENILPYFIKFDILSKIFLLLLIFNDSLALSDVLTQWKIYVVIRVQKKVTNTTH